MLLSSRRRCGGSRCTWTHVRHNKQSDVGATRAHATLRKTRLRITTDKTPNATTRRAATCVLCLWAWVLHVCVSNTTVDAVRRAPTHTHTHTRTDTHTQTRSTACTRLAVTSQARGVCSASIVQTQNTANIVVAANTTTTIMTITPANKTNLWSRCVSDCRQTNAATSNTTAGNNRNQATNNRLVVVGGGVWW